VRSTNAFQANVFDECYREASSGTVIHEVVITRSVSSSFAGHRPRRHPSKKVITTCCVIGIAVILRRRSSQRVVSSASPSSFEEGHHLRCNLYRCLIANTVPTTITKHPNQSKFIIGKISAERISISRLLLPPSFTERSMPSFDS